MAKTTSTPKPQTIVSESSSTSVVVSSSSQPISEQTSTGKKRKAKTSAPLPEETTVVIQPETITKSSKKQKLEVVPIVPVGDEIEPVVVSEALSSIEQSTMSTKLVDFAMKLQLATNLLLPLKTEFKTLERSIQRDFKNVKKTNKPRKVSSNRQPSGFTKPTVISDQLANFLEKPPGTEMARTEVSREINKYIRSHQLQDPANGRQINPDEILNGLLNVPEEDVLTYFNLQKYLKSHFMKAESTAALLVN